MKVCSKISSSNSVTCNGTGSAHHVQVSAGCKAAQGYAEAVKVGLAEIAKQAQVSEATVSRVVNHRPGVAAETRNRVLQAISALGFEPSATRSRLVGIVVPGLVTPVFAAMVEAIESILASNQLQGVVCISIPGRMNEKDVVASLADSGVSGVLFVSSGNTLARTAPEVLEPLEVRNIPFVCINGPSPGSPAPMFACDDTYAAELAVRHLTSLGHLRIGIAAGPVGNWPSDRRVDGFRAAMRTRAEQGAVDFVVRQEYSVEGGQMAAERLLGQEVTAILAASDQMALGAIRTIRRQGRRVPDDCSVIGHDDSALMEFTAPPLTTVRQPIHQLTQSATLALIALMRGEPIPTDQLLFQPELVIRASTAVVPA